jgi:DNA-3-methyladenine glycosylase I
MIERCAWAGEDAENVRYHDEEWGRPVTDDNRLFEKLCLEGFQSGLSWLTVLKKRPQFRKQFKNFDIPKVARMTEADIERLLQDPGIIRHRGKIVSTINNANRALELQNEFGSLAAYIWRFEPDEMAAPEKRGGIESETEASRALSRDLRKRGWTFVGPTTVYAFMQAMGLVNDHYSHCFARAECAHERKTLKRPG